MRRIKLSKIFSPSRLSLLIIGLLALGISPRVFSPASAATSLATSTDANTAIVQFSLPEPSQPINPQRLGITPTPPFTLYGNGLLVCGHDSQNPFNVPADSSLYKLPTSTVLSQTDIQTLIQQISDTGFFTLNKEYYKQPIIETQNVLRVNLLSGAHYVLYYKTLGETAPAAYTSTLNILKNECSQLARTTYTPSTLTLQSLKNADATGFSITPISMLSPSTATTFSSAMIKADKSFTTAVTSPYLVKTTTTNIEESDQTITGTAVASVVQEFANKLPAAEFVWSNGTIYEFGVKNLLPKIKNPLKVNYASIRGTAASPGNTPVRIVLLLPNSGGSTDRLTEAQALAPAVQNWYCGQVGSCYNFAGVSVIRGSRTASDYMCEGGCSDPISSIIDMVASNDQGTVYRSDVDTIVVPGWPTHDAHNCGVANVADTIGVVDLYQPTYHSRRNYYCPPGGTIAHEAGHTFGLPHTSDGTLMDPNSDCDIGDQSEPTCTLNKSQAAWLRTSTTYFGITQPASTLYEGQRLNIGHSLVSPSATYQLTLQSDGNLVVYNSAHQAVWTNNTAGKSTSFLGMQIDGNLVQYNTSNKPIWATNTRGRGADHLVMQDDGNLVLETPSNRAVWSINTGIIGPRHSLHTGDTIKIALPGQGLLPDQYIASPSGAYQFILQSDGNLVDYNADHVPIWTNHTDGQPSAYVVMQPDGNLVQYGTSGQILWQSNTQGLGGTDIVLQDDGNLVMFNSAGQPVWSIYTGRVVQPAPSTLSAGQSLSANQYLLSPSGTYQLIMQPDGNLVLYVVSTHQMLWNSGTYGSGGQYVIMQPDSNFVMYNSSGHVVWQSTTFGLGGNHLVLQDDSNVVILSPENQPIWSIETGVIRPPAPSTLFTNQRLMPMQSLLSSDGRYQFIVQPDGNMVVYNGAHQAIWQSGTFGQSLGYLIMQPDGNLVLYNSAGQPIWYVGYGTGATNLIMQPDGNLVLYNDAHQPIWYTNTEGR